MKTIARWIFAPLALMITSGCNSQNASTENAAPGGAASTRSDNTTGDENAGAGEIAASPQTEIAKPAAGTGNVQGLILFNDKPAQNIEVKLHEKFSTIMGPSGKSYDARTGPNGFFVIKNVPPGKYEGLSAKVFDTDNIVFMQGGILQSKSYDVTADKTLFVDDLNLFKSDLKIAAPKAGATIPGKSVTIKWASYPDAAYYKVSVIAGDFKTDTGVFDERIDGTSYQIAKALPKGEYTVSVKAYNSHDHKIAEDPESYKFRVAS